MHALKQLAKNIPGAPSLYKSLRNLFTERRVPQENAKDVFVDIFKGQKFGGTESVSGPGSDLQQTRVIVEQLPIVLRELSISSFLDIPCGDFHWMRRVQLEGVRYIGADIVDELVERNKREHGRHDVEFRNLDLIEDELPPVDLIFCRDCLVHLPFETIFKALRNVCRSNAKYLLTTTFPSRAGNHDIPMGHWRPLNLQAAPFNLPAPVRLINEGCTEDGGIYGDKSLGLWRTSDIETVLATRRR